MQPKHTKHGQWHMHSHAPCHIISNSNSNTSKTTTKIIPQNSFNWAANFKRLTANVVPHRYALRSEQYSIFKVKKKIHSFRLFVRRLFYIIYIHSFFILNTLSRMTYAIISNMNIQTRQLNVRRSYVSSLFFSHSMSHKCVQNHRCVLPAFALFSICALNVHFPFISLPAFFLSDLVNIIVLYYFYSSLSPVRLMFLILFQFCLLFQAAVNKLRCLLVFSYYIKTYCAP